MLLLLLSSPVGHDIASARQSKQNHRANKSQWDIFPVSCNTSGSLVFDSQLSVHLGTKCWSCEAIFHSYVGGGRIQMQWFRYHCETHRETFAYWSSWIRESSGNWSTNAEIDRRCQHQPLPPCFEQLHQCSCGGKEAHPFPQLQADPTSQGFLGRTMQHCHDCQYKP